MADSSWTFLYKNALRSDPEQLLQKIQVASEAIHNRLRGIGFAFREGDVREQRALFLALSDLRVLKISLKSPSSRKDKIAS